MSWTDVLLLVIPVIVPMIITVGGIVLLAVGLGHRVGSSLHCAACGYERGQAGTRCPECGSKWSGRGALVRGRVARRPYLVVAGAALAVLGMSLAFATYFGLTNRLMPTKYLVRNIVTDGGFTGSYWDAIEGRAMTADETGALFAGLLDTRRRLGFVGPDAEAWLDARVGEDVVAPDLVDRYYDEMLTLEVIGPDVGELGQPLVFTMEIHDSRPLNQGTETFVLVGGVVLDGRDMGGRAAKARETFALERVAGRSRRLKTTPVMPRMAGRISVRIVVWQLYGPPGIGDEVRWGQDGEPVIPDDMIRIRRIVLEHELEVRDPRNAECRRYNEPAWMTQIPARFPRMTWGVAGLCSSR